MAAIEYNSRRSHTVKPQQRKLCVLPAGRWVKTHKPALPRPPQTSQPCPLCTLGLGGPRNQSSKAVSVALAELVVPPCRNQCRLTHPVFLQCEKKLKTKGSLPPKYALELLTIYAWEQGSGVEDFDTAEGFRTVLELVTQYQQLCIFWTVNYSFEDEIVRNFLLTQIQKPRCPERCPASFS